MYSGSGGVKVLLGFNGWFCMIVSLVSVMVLKVHA